MGEVVDALRRGALAGARQLDLAGSGLDAVPGEVRALAGTLEVLDLGHNPIETLPDWFGELGRLRVLFCSGTALRALPAVLGGCAALEQIGARGCAIERVPAGSLPRHLRWLTLTDNRIAALPDAIGERPGLRKLLLSGNRMARVPDALAGAAGLELLRVAANGIEAIPPFLPRMPHLAWLSFSAGRPPMGSAAVAPGGIAVGAVLGEGSSGRVHAARWAGRNVALKRFRAAIGSDGHPEAEIAAALAAGEHPNLLGGLAAVAPDATGAPGLLLPQLPPGFRPLAGPPDLASCTRDVYPDGLRLRPGAARKIGRDVALAGAHLHGRDLLHGDLYAHNIHWDGDAGRALLGDLGAASPLAAVLPGADAALGALDVRAWGILAAELLDRAPPGEADATLAALRDAALAPDGRDRPPLPAIAAALAD